MQKIAYFITSRVRSGYNNTFTIKLPKNSPENWFLEYNFSRLMATKWEDDFKHEEKTETLATCFDKNSQKDRSLCERNE